MTLHYSLLRPEANALLDVLGRASEMEGLTLVGGPALALQIGHRTSLDFDFAQFGGVLSGFLIDQLISRLKREGHQTQMITSPDMISRFKINYGMNLLDHARDYVIDGVKVTFFVHGKNNEQEAFYQSTEKVCKVGMSFDVLGIEGLKVAKTLVLADRVRSRDLYDLYILMRDYDYSLENLFTTVKTLGSVDDPEYYKSIMRGEIPLDKDDEGLDAVNLVANYNQIYGYFSHEIDEYETTFARDYFL
ncbi:MAG: hypothetical protein GXP22_07840 [Gammaproteobacteria bacterium]|nr:hypothetical protein [Gammaproteobacteria bacterium]